MHYALTWLQIALCADGMFKLVNTVPGSQVKCPHYSATYCKAIRSLF